MVVVSLRAFLFLFISLTSFAQAACPDLVGNKRWREDPELRRNTERENDTKKTIKIRKEIFDHYVSMSDTQLVFRVREWFDDRIKSTGYPVGWRPNFFGFGEKPINTLENYAEEFLLSLDEGDVAYRNSALHQALGNVDVELFYLLLMSMEKGNEKQYNEWKESVHLTLMLWEFESRIRKKGMELFHQ